MDVTTQAQVINLLEDLQRKLNLTYLFIAHDLSVVRHISDRIVPMYLGQIVDIADWKSLYEHPVPPYTQALLEVIPVPDPDIEAQRKRQIIKGKVPSMTHRPSGCPFSTRCTHVVEQCKKKVPVLTEREPDHRVACFNVL